MKVNNDDTLPTKYQGFSNLQAHDYWHQTQNFCQWKHISLKGSYPTLTIVILSAFRKRITMKRGQVLIKEEGQKEGQYESFQTCCNNCYSKGSCLQSPAFECGYLQIDRDEADDTSIELPSSW